MAQSLGSAEPHGVMPLRESGDDAWAKLERFFEGERNATDAQSEELSSTEASATRRRSTDTSISDHRATAQRYGFTSGLTRIESVGLGRDARAALGEMARYSLVAAGVSGHDEHEPVGHALTVLYDCIQRLGMLPRADREALIGLLALAAWFDLLELQPMPAGVGSAGIHDDWRPPPQPCTPAGPRNPRAPAFGRESIAA